MIMLRFQQLPISQKLSLVITATAGFGMMLVFIAFVSYEIIAQRASAERLLTAMATTIAFNSTSALVFHDQRSAQDALAGLRGTPQISSAIIRDNTGKIFAVYPSEMRVGSPPGASLSWLSDSASLRQPISFEGKNVGELELQADLSNLWSNLGWGGAITLALTLFAFLVSHLIGRRFQRLITDPIRSLANTSSIVSEYQDYSVRASKYGNDEIGRLVDDFNHMLEQIQARDQKLETYSESLERTVKERTAELMRIRDSALSASQAKSDFLANMSHEIRTPMNAIIGMTHLALQNHLSAKQRNYIEKVDLAAQSLLGIINDILDFSKIEAGKLRFERINFQLDAVLNNLADVSMLKAHEKGLELLYDIAPDVPRALIGDPLRLGQVLTNLVNNAIKFTEKGEITVRIRSQVAPANNSDNICLQISVTDTGIGLSAEQQALLFKAFTQADSSTTRKYGGTGLGLAICKRLVAMMDGVIGIHSTVDVGSTFSFSACFGIQAIQVQLHATQHEIAGLRVLVVDDNACSREILVDMLTSLGFAAKSISDGFAVRQELEQAQAENQPYSVAIVDWHMPGMDGIETTRRIRLSENVRHIPVCMMVSAYSQEELIKQIQQTNVEIDGLVIKPIAPSALFRRMLEIFGKSIALKTPPKIAATSDETLLRNARILLVEDNTLNQELALEILHPFGVQIDVAENGHVALEKIEAGHYDLVLMDCQMPEMDGFEATHRLRRDARFTNLPIIAMTANVMADDREKCIQSGMNDHVAKPIDTEQLLATLVRWIGKDRGTNGNPSMPPPHVSCLDSSAALNRIGGDTILYLRILKRFREDHANAIVEMRTAFDHGDEATAKRLVHSLKGLASSIGAASLYPLCSRLEQAIQQNDTQQLEPLMSEAESALQSILTEIEFILAEDQESTQETLPSLTSEKELQQLLQEFSCLLSDNDILALNWVAPVTKVLKNSAEEKDFQLIAELTERYQFDKAQQKLAELAKKMQINLEQK